MARFGCGAPSIPKEIVATFIFCIRLVVLRLATGADMDEEKIRGHMTV